MADVFEIPPGTGQIASKVRWLVLTPQLEVIGEVNPVFPTAVTNNTNANIMRALRGLTLRQNDMRTLNPNTDRLMPVWEYEDGSRRPGYSGWPCGVFMFGSRTRDRGSLYTMHNATLMDVGYQLDQEMDQSFGVASHADIYPALVGLVEGAGITHYSIEPTSQKIKDPINWPVGTHRLQIIRDLCRLCGFFKPWFDNVGVLQLRSFHAPRAEDAHVYDLDTTAGRVVRDSIQENDNLLSAPNLFIVISNGPTQTEIQARSPIDPRLPHSYENIGYWRPKTIRMQGLEDIRHAQMIADAYATQSVDTYETVTFASAPNPKHDTFDSVLYDGNLYRELDWSLELSPAGGSSGHTHSCVRNPYDSEMPA